MRLCLARCLCLVTLFLFTLSLPARAEDRVMVVLDASGSMWGQVEGRSKIEIARDAVSGLFAQWAAEPGLTAGLTVYGHRRKGDCSDIELLAAPAPVPADGYAPLLSQLSPKGKTPLSAAVVQAAQALKHDETKATVILVSDGIETCEADPCAIGQMLEQTGVDFTAHVIGFDVAAEADRAQLRCLAENTGGVFTSAGSSGELERALDSLGDVEAELIVPPVVEAGFLFDAVWNGPNEGADGIALRRIGDRSGDFLAYVQHNGRNPVQLRAPTELGSFEAVYVIHPYVVEKRRFVATAQVDIVPLRPMISAPETVTAGERFELSWRGPEAGGDGFAIALPESEDIDRVSWKQHSNKNPVKLRAPNVPGTYEIRYILNPYKAQKREVVARRRIVVE